MVTWAINQEEISLLRVSKITAVVLYSFEAGLWYRALAMAGLRIRHDLLI